MWRYVATTLVGDGTEVSPVVDVRFDEPTLTVPLSEWPVFEAKLTPEQPVDVTTDSCIYTLYGNRVLAATIVQSVEESGSEVTVIGHGFTSAAANTPWTAAPQRLYQANTGDVFRLIWAHLQAQPGGNLGLELTPFTTLATVGRKFTRTDADGNATEVDEPFILSPAETRDLGQRLADLVSDGIEFRERHYLDGDAFRHVLECGPRIGDDLTRLRFEVGENVTTPVSIESRAVDAPTEVLVVGDGENPPWGVARTGRPGLRRVAAFTDAGATSDADAAMRAAARLAKYARRATGYGFTVVDSPTVGLADFDVGDTIVVTGTRWGGDGFTGVGRITSITYHPSTGTADVDIIPTQEAA